jgi:hypothetical protein
VCYFGVLRKLIFNSQKNIYPVANFVAHNFFPIGDIAFVFPGKNTREMQSHLLAVPALRKTRKKKRMILKGKLLEFFLQKLSEGIIVTLLSPKFRA